MPPNFLCLKDKPKLTILRVRHLIKHEWHMTKAVICTRFIIKDFMKEILRFAFLLKNVTRIIAYIHRLI